MVAFDLHLDLALSAIQLNRDLTLSVEACRRSEDGIEGRMRGHNTVTFPEMRRGHVGLCIATVLGRVTPGPGGPAVHRTHELAYAAAQGMLAYYRQLESLGICRIVRSAGDLTSATAAWSAATPPAEAPLGFLLGTEGADCITAPSQLEHWWESGLRTISLVHFGVSKYAHGTGTEGSLTPDGHDLLYAMDEIGAILDITHQSDTSFWESLERFKGPVFASHQNCRALVPGPRQFTDDQLKALIERDAVIGHALDNWQLHPNYIRGQTPKSAISLSNFVDQIDRISQLAGNARHSAIGSDLDGLFGSEQTPEEVDTIADVQKLPPLLKARGYADIDVANVMAGNAIRFFERTLPPS